jgi:hypothetical protein
MMETDGEVIIQWVLGSANVFNIASIERLFGYVGARALGV